MIKVVAFDLGGVLYTYNHSILMRDIASELGTNKEAVTEAWKNGIIEFEKGKISEENFWDNFLDGLGLKHDHAILHQIVIEHFIPIQGSIDILNRLKGKYTFALISNQTDWVYELNEKYHFKEIFDIWIVSNEVALRKPQKEIFQLLIDKSKVNPNKILFIDDSLAYKKEPEKLGIKFLHFQNPYQLEQDLEKFIK